MSKNEQVMAAINFSAFPKKTRDFVLKRQCEIKMQKGLMQFSQQQTIIMLLNELETLTEKKEKKDEQKHI